MRLPRSVGRTLLISAALACCGAGSKSPSQRAVTPASSPKLASNIVAPLTPGGGTKAATAEITKLDPLGVTMVNPTKSGGRTWFSKWTSARTLRPSQTDPLDPEFQNRGEGTFAIAADGVATVTGSVQRHYIWDQSRAKKWQNVELTFYAMRVAETNAPAYSGFIIEARTDDGHNDDPARQCAGASYAMAMYYNGRAEFKKEGKHPIYSSKNPSTMIWPGDGPVPRDTWVGFKATVRDVPGGVELVLYRDLSDGKNGGTWTKVLDYTDKGGWVAGDGKPLCGLPADRKIEGAFPILLVRNDNATMRYKKMSVREID